MTETEHAQRFAQAGFHQLIGLQRDFAEGGVARLSIPASSDLANGHQHVHGGVLMTLLDCAMSIAAQSRVQFLQSVVTIDMTTQFLAAADGALVAHGEASGGGRTVCFCEARVVDAQGQVVAKAVGTFRYVAVR